MSKEMLINVSEGEECRIALVEDGKLQELYMERTSATSHVGNIYKGRVTNVEPSIQAAFVDFGLGRNGFLHISDLMPSYFGESGEDITESVGRKLSRRDRPPIQRCLRRGDEITVQIIKEGIGTKGPTLSTYVSIPGRILVMMPGMAKFGVSRKIEDEDERRRLRGILDGLKPIDDVGFIIRTAGVGKSKTEIDRDLKYLTRLWETITKKLKETAPVELYTEGDLVTRTVRDVFTTDVERIVVDNKDVAKKIKEFFKISMPRTKNKVDVYEDTVPLFHKYEIEHELEQMYSRHVPLPSGGSLVIDSTEAVVAIDVNSGKFREHNDAEKTAFMTDMEAADEIPRQLKLRDLGGVIICDFIDLRFDRNRRELEMRLHENLKNDRAKTKVLRMSQFGIIEMTRQRMRPSLKRSIYSDCPHCKGSGLVKTPESMALDLMRRLAISVSDERVQRVELTVCSDVALHLLNKKRAQLAELESETTKKILILQDAALGLDEQKLQLFDSRDGLIFIDALGMDPHQGLGPQVVRPGERGGGSRRGGRRGRGRPLPEHRNQPRDEEHDDETPIERGENREDHREEESEALAAPHPRSRAEESDNDEIGEAPQDLPVEQPRGRGGRSRRGGRDNPRPAPEIAEAAEVEAADEEEEESQVVDVEDAAEPIGDAPRGMGGDRNDRGYQNDRGGGRDGARNGGRTGDRGPRNDRGGRNDGGQRNDRGPRNDGAARNDRGPRGDGGQRAPRNDQPPREDQPNRNAPNDGAPFDNRGPRGDGGPRNDQPPREGQPNRNGANEGAAFDNRGEQNEEGGGGRRRRRRRGRRGRGRSGDQADRGPAEGNVLPPLEGELEVDHSHDDDRPAPGNELPPPELDHDEEDPEVPGPGNEKFPPPRPVREPADAKGRRRRGGKRHRARREQGPARPQYVGLPKDEPEVLDEDIAADTEGPDLAKPPASPRPQRTPPRPTADEEPITPTGSSDKHLVRDDDDADDAVEPEPVRRPQSYRDLDEVPEDYDE